MIANTPALAAALEPWYPQYLVHNAEGDEWAARNQAQLADAALRWMDARLATDEALIAVATAIAEAHDDAATAAVDAVRTLLLGGDE